MFYCPLWASSAQRRAVFAPSDRLLNDSVVCDFVRQGLQADAQQQIKHTDCMIRTNVGDDILFFKKLKMLLERIIIKVIRCDKNNKPGSLNTAATSYLYRIFASHLRATSAGWKCSKFQRHNTCDWFALPQHGERVKCLWDHQSTSPGGVFPSAKEL